MTGYIWSPGSVGYTHFPTADEYRLIEIEDEGGMTLTMSWVGIDASQALMLVKVLARGQDPGRVAGFQDTDSRY